MHQELPSAYAPQMDLQLEVVRRLVSLPDTVQLVAPLLWLHVRVQGKWLVIAQLDLGRPRKITVFSSKVFRILCLETGPRLQRFNLVIGGSVCIH